jgi:ribonuclease HII
MVKTKLIVGVDEAGYGPSMGPLTVCATMWRVPESLCVEEMSRQLEPEIQPRPLQPTSNHVPIGDSKRIHREPYAKEGLALGAQFLVSILNQPVVENAADCAANWESVLEKICADDWLRVRALPCYAAPGSRASLYFAPETSSIYQAAFRKLSQCDLKLVALEMRILDESEFNRKIDTIGNKSTLLSETTLFLVREMLLRHATMGECVEVYCDKHGGRNRYQSMLCHCFDQAWFSIETEGQSQSRYRTTWRDIAMQIQFQVGGDTLFPSAAASMMAKWTREWMMDRLNSFWAARFPIGIKPTAGYYVDAVRFANQIQGELSKLKWDRDQWWRKK